MKILIAVSEYNQRGGYPRYGAQLALAMARRGHAVTVLSRNAEIRDEDRILEFRSYRALGKRILLPMASEPVFIGRALRSMAGEFDAVVSVGIPTLEPVVLIGLGTQRGYYRATKASLPAFSPRRAFETVRPFHKVVMGWERAMLRRAAPQAVIVGGERYAREYPDLFGYPAGRVEVMPFGVTPKDFTFDAELRERTRRELGIAPQTKVMLNIANRFRQKGLDVLCEALKRMPSEPEWTCLFAGGGSRSAPLVARTRDLVRVGRAHLLGVVPDVRALYCAADLVVFPSRYDPWGLVITESLSCGTPVVSSNTIGASCAVREGENGTLVDPSDPEAIARGATALLGRTFDRAAVASSVEWLTFDAGAERLEALLLRRAGADATVAG